VIRDSLNKNENLTSTPYLIIITCKSRHDFIYMPYDIPPYIGVATNNLNCFRSSNLTFISIVYPLLKRG
jgi:hypothetical protein